MSAEVTVALIGAGSALVTLAVREVVAAVVQNGKRRDKVRELDVWLSGVLEPYISDHTQGIDVLGKRHHVIVPWIGILIHAIDQLGYRHWDGSRLSVDDLKKQLDEIPQRRRSEGFLLEDLRQVVRRMRAGDSKPPTPPTKE